MELYDSHNDSDDELYQKISKVYKKKDTGKIIDDIDKKIIHSNIYMSKFERLKLIDYDDDIEIEIKAKKKNKEPILEIKIMKNLLKY